MHAYPILNGQTDLKIAHYSAPKIWNQNKIHLEYFNFDEEDN